MRFQALQVGCIARESSSGAASRHFSTTSHVTVASSAATRYGAAQDSRHAAGIRPAVEPAVLCSSRSRLRCSSLNKRTRTTGRPDVSAPSRAASCDASDSPQLSLGGRDRVPIAGIQQPVVEPADPGVDDNQSPGEPALQFLDGQSPGDVLAAKHVFQPATAVEDERDRRIRMHRRSRIGSGHIMLADAGLRRSVNLVALVCRRACS